MQSSISKKFINNNCNSDPAQTFLSPKGTHATPSLSRSVAPPVDNQNAPSVSKFSWLKIFKFWNFFSITSNKNETPPASAVQNDIPEQNEENSIPASKFLFDMICSWLPPLSFEQSTTEVPITANIVGVGTDAVTDTVGYT